MPVAGFIKYWTSEKVNPKSNPISRLNFICKARHPKVSNLGAISIFILKKCHFGYRRCAFCHSKLSYFFWLCLVTNGNKHLFCLIPNVNVVGPTSFYHKLRSAVLEHRGHSPLLQIHTLRVLYVHAAANLNSGYSKYAKVARALFLYNCTPNTLTGAHEHSVVCG